VTVRVMSQDEQLAALTVIRDYLDSQAFYWRRRGDSPADRQRAIDLEELAGLADDVLTNWRTQRRTTDA